MNNKIKKFDFIESQDNVIKSINEFENQVGFLPKSYKDFLLKFNGGKPNNNFDCFYYRKKFYHIFFYYGFYSNNDYYYASINYFLNSTIYPENTIPIATDGGGNHYILSLENGLIYFWNHEKSDRFNKNLKNLKKVAKSFEDLILKTEKSEDLKSDIKTYTKDGFFIID